MDITGHYLLDIYIIHLFTNFKLKSVLPATKTNFLLFHKKYKH